jgi:putative tryptophan/tyrosine transport system substrate-binding protein
MRRREFIAGLGFTAASPALAYAQQRAMPVIGYVSGSIIKLAERSLANVRKGLAEYGYVEGQNFRFEFREANFQYDLLPILFRELVDLKVSVIAVDATAKLESAKAATQSIPIVFNIGIDPVENGFVASLNRPGGNITGSFNLFLILTGKRLEVLHELLPSVKKFAFILDPANTTIANAQLLLAQAAADSLGLNLVRLNAHTPDDFESAFATAIREGAGGMVVGADALFFVFPTQMARLAAQYRLPAIYIDYEPVLEGGLISYGTDQDESFRLVGTYAARILKGEKPADMPVQQLTKTKFVINLKTAKALGIAVPISLLGRADEVIE